MGFPVRAIVRGDDERTQSLRALGAEVFVADLPDLRAVRRAFQGIKRAYFVYPMRPGLIEATAFYREPPELQSQILGQVHVTPAYQKRSTGVPSARL
jgi:hypothetical protein